MKNALTIFFVLLLLSSCDNSYQDVGADADADVDDDDNSFAMLL